jgi:hypothetical protein
MAPDLIPPPSPAGKPPPDGDAEDRADAALAEAAHSPRPREPEAAGPGGRAPFRSRFGFLWGALAGIAVCVAAVTVTLATTSGDNGPALAKNWSAWKPDTSRMLDGAADIAAHVGREYKLESGDQLVAVRSGGLELSGVPLGVAVRPKGGELQTLEGDGLLYVLSGLGPSGRLTGKATKERGRLLMREALELSLYSFRYLDDVTMVAVLLPPPAADDTKPTSTDPDQLRAIFYRPGDLLAQLQVPLSRTLSPKAPTPKTIAKPEAARIDSLALRNLFLATVQALDNDNSYLVLVEPDTIS